MPYKCLTNVFQMSYKYLTNVLQMLCSWIWWGTSVSSTGSMGCHSSCLLRKYLQYMTHEAVCNWAMHFLFSYLDNRSERRQSCCVAPGALCQEGGIHISRTSSHTPHMFLCLSNVNGADTSKKSAREKSTQGKAGFYLHCTSEKTKKHKNVTPSSFLHLSTSLIGTTEQWFNSSVSVMKTSKIWRKIGVVQHWRSCFQVAQVFSHHASTYKSTTLTTCVTF